ncbi:MAG: DUF4442 domain-containing protein [Candidatus Schekmanbacteria bacterium]|nr:DUF4442 domain-containing protein [Candidatus Schekmanbacteria bacterium]
MELFSNPGTTFRSGYDLLKNLPGGSYLFSRLIGLAAPYSATIDARLVELSPGYAKVEMADRRAVRNHLDCVHAVALANLAELTTGAAMTYGMPDGTRGILAGLSIEYVKKARGKLTAICHCSPPATAEKRHYDVVAKIFDQQGELVAQGTAKWLIGPSLQ